LSHLKLPPSVDRDRRQKSTLSLFSRATIARIIISCSAVICRNKVRSQLINCIGTVCYTYEGARKANRGRGKESKFAESNEPWNEIRSVFRQIKAIRNCFRTLFITVSLSFRFGFYKLGAGLYCARLLRNRFQRTVKRCSLDNHFRLAIVLQKKKTLPLSNQCLPCPIRDRLFRWMLLGPLSSTFAVRSSLHFVLSYQTQLFSRTNPFFFFFFFSLSLSLFLKSLCASFAVHFDLNSISNLFAFVFSSIASSPCPLPSSGTTCRPCLAGNNGRNVISVASFPPKANTFRARNYSERNVSRRRIRVIAFRAYSDASFFSLNTFAKFTLLFHSHRFRSQRSSVDLHKSIGIALFQMLVLKA
jgi:hypothetical protein